MYVGFSCVNTFGGAAWECFNVKQRESREEGGVGKAGERKVKMPLAAFGSLFRSEKTETDLENTLWVSLYGRRCCKLLEWQPDVCFLAVSISFLLMKRRHLLPPLQMGVTNLL